MTVPSWRDWLFSVKAFIAAMLALYIGLAFSLPRPYWAMTAVYVVANPISGATVSKALDRTLGTVLGAAGAVVLVPLLVNTPELLTFAIALWAGIFLYIALHDRTPRNYVFLLAGYTLPLVALPNVGVPDTIFDVAVARSEEIIVGIIAASIVGTTILPMSVRPILNTRITGWLRDAASWAQEILLAKGAEPGTPIARQRLAADISPLTALISQLRHDADTRDVRRHAEELRGRLLFLLPTLSSISDRLHALRLEMKAFPPELDALIEQIAAWIKAAPDPANEGAPDRLRSALKALEPSAEKAFSWEGLVGSSLITRLRELVDLWQDCLVLQRQIALGSAMRWKPQLRHRPVIGREQHYDRGLMLFSMSSTVLATFFSGLLWIWSGWSGGANAVAFVAIACCFFGGLDRPAPFMRAMLIWSITAYALTGVYLFAVLPRINDFELIALTLAPPFLLIGAFIPRPELSLITLLLATGLAGDLGLQGRYGIEFTSFVDGGIAIASGIIFALVWTMITRPFGADIAAHRLVRAGWTDLASLAAGSRSVDHATLIGRTLDRLGQLMPRLASDATRTLQSIDGLAELRTSYNIVTLQRDRRALPNDTRDLIDLVLRRVAEFFSDCANRGERGAPPDSLLCDIDRTLLAALQIRQDQVRRTTLDALVGLRRGLFPAAPGPVDKDPGRGSTNMPSPEFIAAE